MTKKFHVEITVSAERDVRAIRDFVARDKPQAADKWARSIERKILSLKSMPQRHESRAEAAEPPGRVRRRRTVVVDSNVVKKAAIK